MKQTPRISVLMITYNQAEIVGKSLDSLLRQKDYIYEICINDDCSADDTWKVLKEYASLYPDIIKPVRNEVNVGIFQNTEFSWKRPTGDMIYQIAGDDWVSENYFKEVTRFVSEKNLDPQTTRFCIYGDDVQIAPNGQKITYSNRIIRTGIWPMKLKLRELISGRGICFSAALLKSFVPVCRGRDYSVEMVQDCQPHLFATENYYIPFAGSIYFSGIGVSSVMDVRKQKEHLEKGYELLNAFLAQRGVSLDRADREYCRFRLRYMKFYSDKSLRNLLTAFLSYLGSIDLRLGLKGLQLGRILFVLRKRL